ncbi:hypothetical protein BASA50_006722 [Batrachochytrium salamandrivorans]|uniref:BTB domain-containing protein n=1 Tax=Batrachochytrium salamandrivorans TaxID=1357716 RepID=A0ABQ8FBV1_9FUNG|nr:hypothetical protein BASA60_006890 [Batrachochytrium salamandrivorans]KAH6576437.1 hypothetical protein BASA62_001358 [Batrachochytrium salamandrivorans]KAH6590476.1 hypothetical protein BASA61_005235 [Batrachochytrium salamandrivorans]KAH6594250.1 hypothetical protein BASA50_006722 [Batrachochytrium salamandrivorans]KAH9244175.1 hypothetical protein BASA81_018440 [Batrachochytrium salamandrivorans]
MLEQIGSGIALASSEQADLAIVPTLIEETDSRRMHELVTEYDGTHSQTNHQEDSSAIQMCPMDHTRRLTQTLHSKGFLGGMFSDITVKALGHDFRLHRIILLSNSYFAGMLSNSSWIEQSQDSIAIQFDDPNISIESLMIVFARIYGQSNMSIKTSNAKSLLAAGLYFDDPELCQESMRFIISVLDVSNMLEYLAFCDDFSYGTYSDSILNAIVTHLCHRGYGQLSELVKKLPLHWLARIVGSDCFVCPDELARYEFLRDIISQRSDLDDQLHEGHDCIGGINSSDTLVCDSEDPLDNTKVPDSGNVSDVSFDGTLGYNLELQSKSKALETPLRNKDYNYVLSNAIRFCHIAFGELRAIKKGGHVKGAVLERAIWNQLELEDMIVGSTADDLEIGIGEQSGKEPIPHDDTDRIDGQFLVNVIKGPIFPYQDSRCPPFRFGIEFTNLNQLGAGVKLVSKRAYYAGSYWQVYLQQIAKNNVPKLGIYLQRVTEGGEGWVADESEPIGGDSTAKSAIQDLHSGRYEDKRTQVRTWFQLYCFFPSKCYTLESKPDVFRANQSWGWRSHKLYRDAVDSGENAKLECAVVLCHV